MSNTNSALLVKPVHLVPSAARMSTPLANRMRKELRGDVLFDAASRGRYSTDASFYQIMPIGVVAPRTIKQGGSRWRSGARGRRLHAGRRRQLLCSRARAGQARKAILGSVSFQFGNRKHALLR